MAYYAAVNTGKGFITHADNELAHITGYPGNIWITENTTWATRVGAVAKTKIEAQALVNTAISGSVYPGEHPQVGEQIVIILP